MREDNHNPAERPGRPPRRDDRSARGPEGAVPPELAELDRFLAEALGAGAAPDAPRAERIYRASLPILRGSASPGRRALPGRAWTIAWWLGGATAAAATLFLALRPAPVVPAIAAPVTVAEAPEAPGVAADGGEASELALSTATEPLLVALLERETGRWSHDWTSEGFPDSAAWSAVVPVLETRDTGFDEMAGEVDYLLRFVSSG